MLLPFFRFAAYGQIGSGGGFGHHGKAQGLEGTVDLAGVRIKLAGNRRGNQCGERLLPFEERGHLHQRGFFHDGAEGTGLLALAALDALLMVDPLLAVLVLGDGVDRAGLLARDRHPYHCMVGADFTQIPQLTHFSYRSVPGPVPCGWHPSGN
jgi:hypothetical protein